ILLALSQYRWLPVSIPLPVKPLDDMARCWGFWSCLMKCLGCEDGDGRYQLTNQQRSQITQEWLQGQQGGNPCTAPRRAARQAVPARPAITRVGPTHMTGEASSSANPISVARPGQSTDIVEGSSVAVGREQPQQQRHSGLHPVTAE